MRAHGRVVVLVACLVVVLIVPQAVLAPLGAASAGGLISLAGLGVAFVAISVGRRQAVIAAVATGIATFLTANGEAAPALGVAAMVLVAVGQGLTARWGWNQTFTLLPVTLSFIVSEPLTSPPVETAGGFALAMTAYLVLVAGVIGTIGPRLMTAKKATSPAAAITWRRTMGYTAMLTLTTVITTTIVVVGEWGHTGGWLIMTPFIVIQPRVRDGFGKAINRALGTIAGLGVAFAFAALIDSSAILTVVGIAFAVVAILAKIEHWNYAMYAAFLTPAVVILESIGRSIQVTGDNRLIATVLGVGISLLAMAIAVISDRLLPAANDPSVPADAR